MTSFLILTAALLVAPPAVMAPGYQFGGGLAKQYTTK